VEQDRTAPDPLEVRSAYGLAKRLAENLCVVATDQRQAEVVVARLFAFVGPRIPISAHFAAGNFLGDALANRAILVKGDGRDVRSYLYAGDLPEWCWTLLARGGPGVAYNVGSPVAVNIAELAQLVASLPTPQLPVTIVERAGTQPASWYVPSTSLAEIQLGLQPRTSLEQSFQMTYEWLRGRQ
jgi:dTDP-glucose 4,6-dehydratase